MINKNKKQMENINRILIRFRNLNAINNFSKLKLIFILIFTILLCYNVSAVNIGVSPASIVFNGVLRNGYAEKSIVISTDSQTPINLDLSTRGDIAEWLNISKSNLTVSRDNPLVLKIPVTPPSDISNGNYTGFLNILSSSFGEGTEGHAVGVVRSSIDLYIIVDVIDSENLICSASNVVSESVEKGDDINFNLNIENNGNIRFKPTVNIDLWDKDKITLIKSQSFSGKDILPTTNEIYNFKMSSSSLETGQYFADISVKECYSSNTLTFDVLEPGALKIDGSILGIITNKNANVFDTVPIKVEFKNNGEKDVSAQFQGQVTFGSDITDLLESQQVNVAVSQTNTFNFYFTPKKSGKYVISGRVYYSGKRTFDSSASIDILDKKINFLNYILPAVYIILILLIIAIFYKIHKERKSYSNKLKYLKSK